MRLLLVEDDRMIGESLQKILRSHYTVNWVRSAEDAVLSMETEEYDLVLLDQGLPKQSGVGFLTDLRHRGMDIPVLIITARDTIGDRVIGLDSGADDYLIKPFDMNELEARIRVLLRRRHNRADPLITMGNLTLNPVTRELSFNGKTEVLHGRAYLLIQALLDQPKAILSRHQLEEKVYGWNEEVVSNAIEVHIHTLRRKFGQALIRNIRGVGYTMGHVE